MNIRKLALKVSLVLALFFLTAVMPQLSAARAYEKDIYHTGWYIGGGWGVSQIEDDQVEQEINSALSGLGSLDIEDHDNGLRLLIGYQLFDYLGFEVGFVDLGKADIDAQLLGVPVDGEVEADVYNLDAVARLPVLSGVAIYGKGGGFWWDLEAEVGSLLFEDDDMDASFGGGLAVAMDPNWEGRFEWQRFQDVADADVDYYSFSLVYRFQAF